MSKADADRMWKEGTPGDMLLNVKPLLRSKGGGGSKADSPLPIHSAGNDDPPLLNSIQSSYLGSPSELKVHGPYSQLGTRLHFATQGVASSVDGPQMPSEVGGHKNTTADDEPSTTNSSGTSGGSEKPWPKSVSITRQAQTRARVAAPAQPKSPFYKMDGEGSVHEMNSQLALLSGLQGVSDAYSSRLAAWSANEPAPANSKRVGFGRTWNTNQDHTASRALMPSGCPPSTRSAPAGPIMLVSSPSAPTNKPKMKSGRNNLAAFYSPPATAPHTSFSKSVVGNSPLGRKHSYGDVPSRCAASPVATQAPQGPGEPPTAPCTAAAEAPSRSPPPQQLDLRGERSCPHLEGSTSQETPPRQAEQEAQDQVNSHVGGPLTVHFNYGASPKPARVAKAAEEAPRPRTTGAAELIRSNSFKIEPALEASWSLDRLCSSHSSEGARPSMSGYHIDESNEGTTKDVIEPIRYQLRPMDLQRHSRAEWAQQANLHQAEHRAARDRLLATSMAQQSRSASTGKKLPGMTSTQLQKMQHAYLKESDLVSSTLKKIKGNEDEGDSGAVHSTWKLQAARHKELFAATPSAKKATGSWRPYHMDFLAP